jgi:hypothetical protein
MVWGEGEMFLRNFGKYVPRNERHSPKYHNINSSLFQHNWSNVQYFMSMNSLYCWNNVSLILLICANRTLVKANPLNESWTFSVNVNYLLYSLAIASDSEPVCYSWRHKSLLILNPHKKNFHEIWHLGFCRYIVTLVVSARKWRAPYVRTYYKYFCYQRYGYLYGY